MVRSESEDCPNKHVLSEPVVYEQLRTLLLTALEDQMSKSSRIEWKPAT